MCIRDRNAAGCTLKGDWEEVETEIVSLLQEAVKRANGLKDITEDALKDPGLMSV